MDRRVDTLGQLLRRHRRAAGLTQQDLADRAGISERTISDVERGLRDRIYGDTAGRLAAALDLAPAERSAFEAAAHGEPAGSRVPVTQYARSGDVHIAYQVVGEGNRDILFVPGIISHLDLWWEDPVASSFFRNLSTLGRLILFDKRDTGLSDPSPRESPLEERMDDVRAVLEACGSQQAVLFGYSEGGPMSLLFAATYPQRVPALILGAASARWSAAPDYPCGQGSEVIFSAMETLAGTRWGQGDSVDWFAPSRAGSERARLGFARWERMAASPSALLRMHRMVRAIDVRAILAAVDVPTLIIQRRNDRITPVCHGRFLAANLPRARYFEQPGDHVLWLGDTQAMFAEIDVLLGGLQSHQQTERALATILCLERKAQSLAGYDADRFAAYAKTAGKIIAAQGGRHMALRGEGRMLAMFDGPGRAIRCACALRDAALTVDIPAGVGLHCGEVEQTSTGPLGLSVDIAWDVASLAGPGEVVATRTVRDLVVGSPMSFAERGTFELSRISEWWTLFTAESQASAR